MLSVLLSIQRATRGIVYRLKIWNRKHANYESYIRKVTVALMIGNVYSLTMHYRFPLGLWRFYWW